MTSRRAIALAVLLAAVTPVAALAQALSGTRGVSLTEFTPVVPVEGGYGYAPPPAFGPTMYARLRSGGVNLVRLVVRPLPLMAGSPAAQDRAREQVLAAVRQLAAAQISTIVDIHPWPPDTAEQEAALICTPAGSGTLERVLVELAVPLAEMRGAAALELLNEPKRCQVGGQVRWPVLQQQLVRRVRAVAPTLPLVVSGPAGQLDDLLALDVKPYLVDPNILFSFHFYEPYIFTTPSYYNADPVPFPSPGGVVAGTAAFAQADRSGMTTAQSADLFGYLTRPFGEAQIAARFAALDRWRRAEGVPARRVVMGEYGIVRTANSGTPADYAASVRWLKIVTREAQRSGIRPIFWQWAAKPSFLYNPQTGTVRNDIAEAIGVVTP